MCVRVPVDVGVPAAPAYPGHSFLQVVSDLDDTLHPAWKDTRFVAKHAYPGVLTLLRLLLLRGSAGAPPLPPLLHRGWFAKHSAALAAAGVEEDPDWGGHSSPPLPAAPAPHSPAPDDDGQQGEACPVLASLEALGLPRYDARVGGTDASASASASAFVAGGNDSLRACLSGVTVITARPGGPGGIVTASTHRILQQLGLVGATVMAGTLRSSASLKAIAAQKLRNFRHLVQLFPEARFLLLGDAGQADAALAAQATALYGRRVVLGALCHDVTPDRAHTGDGGLKARYAAVDGVAFFDTYAGAAGAAAHLGLLQPLDVVEVAHAVRADFEAAGVAAGRVPPAAADLVARDFARFSAYSDRV